MAIAAAYKFGKCTAYVDDRCIVRDRGEIDRSLRRIYEIYMESELAREKEACEAEAKREG